MLALIRLDGEQSPHALADFPLPSHLAIIQQIGAVGDYGAISEPVLTLTEERQTVNTCM